MLKPKLHDGKSIGWELRRENRYYFFGTRHLKREQLFEVFPNYRFSFLKQVHGRAVVSADDSCILEADAHFTSLPKVALVAITADCCPILLSSKSEICAVHAGWRGLAQNIVAHAKPKLQLVTFAAIGPHIQRDSFEIGPDVAEELSAAAPAGTENLIYPGKGDRRFFDLNALAHAQLRAAFGLNLEIVNSGEDTLSNPEYHSFRRGKAPAERQYSFVVIED